MQNRLHRHDAAHVAGAQLSLVVAVCIALTIAAGARPAFARLEPAPAAAPVRAAVALTAASTPLASAGMGAATEDAGLIRLQELTSDAARLWNASNPVSTAANPPAKPFHLSAAGVLDEARAVDCMTAAVYYEAGYESLEGQRAVAQVVLNRLRNPLFPKTVCGVVFQGSERATGCQFTFTCDGTLARKPAGAGWERARKVAVAALHGHVMKKVGNATHYHADYVAPYWSPSLVKVAVVGTHIFYRWTGGMGLPPAFGGRYAGGEMKGLQIATLDGLSQGAGELGVAAAADAVEAAPEQVAVVDAAPAPTPAAADSVAEPMVDASAVVAKAGPVMQPEELDWQGRPRQKGPPRLATPSSGLRAF